MFEKSRSLVEDIGEQLQIRFREVGREYELPENTGTCILVKSAKDYYLGVWQNGRNHRFSDPIFSEFFSNSGGFFMLYPFHWQNYLNLSEFFPRLKPRPAGVRSSFGCGDRLGMVSTAHLEALKRYGMFPVIAQQSPRELEKTHRTFREVLLGAAWGILESGLDTPFGADADHIKEPGSLEAAVEAGFTMYTLDVSGEARSDVERMGVEELEQEYRKFPTDQQEYYRWYLDREYCLQDGTKLSFPEDVLLPLVVTYAPALDFVERMNETISGKIPGYDLEVSLDEGGVVTSPEAHFLFAEELHRRGVDFQSLALRFPGSFEKGIDYRGDREKFSASANSHATVAREIAGYRLSLHSGSDKFSIYPAWREATGGLFHIKTSGTNWLKALEAIALCDPALLRDVYALGIQTLPENRKAYHISIPDDAVDDTLAEWSDHRLPELFSRPAVRQVLHISYGSIL
ncbi:MAG TPA: tagaturonate epimerase family protein, partial [Atribacteraceae bacterium]|nr:tagaturonate epimerase family protein [Atribacteraceae bacterium]